MLRSINNWSKCTVVARSTGHCIRQIIITIIAIIIIVIIVIVISVIVIIVFVVVISIVTIIIILIIIIVIMSLTAFRCGLQSSNVCTPKDGWPTSLCASRKNG